MKFIRKFLFKNLLPYSIITAFFYFSLAVIPQYLLQQYSIQIAQDIVNFSTNAVFNIRFNYIGFFIPLIISAFILVFGIIFKRYKFNKTAMILILAFILFGFLSTFFNFVRVSQNGASLDAPLVLFAMTLFSILLYLNDYKTALLFSYPIGFICGLASDIISTGAFNVGVYGGFGLFDGDFVLPLAFLITTSIFYVWNLRRKNLSSHALRG